MLCKLMARRFVTGPLEYIRKERIQTQERKAKLLTRMVELKVVARTERGGEEREKKKTQLLDFWGVYRRAVASFFFRLSCCVLTFVSPF